MPNPYQPEPDLGSCVQICNTGNRIQINSIRIFSGKASHRGMRGIGINRIRILVVVYGSATPVTGSKIIASGSLVERLATVECGAPGYTVSGS